MIRCISTAFCNPAIEQRGGVTLIRDYTVERLAEGLGLKNFIVAAGNRDDFSALPNTDYARSVMSKLNDAVNLLRAVRVIPRYKIKFTSTRYRYRREGIGSKLNRPISSDEDIRLAIQQAEQPVQFGGDPFWNVPNGGWDICRAPADR